MITSHYERLDIRLPQHVIIGLANDRALTRSTRKPVPLILSSFFAPEMVVTVASQQLWQARDSVIDFRSMLFSILNTPI